jgi:hypothetical protein
VAAWLERGNNNVQDYWRELKVATRKFCKGWGANINSPKKRDKIIMVEKLKEMDKQEEE